MKFTYALVFICLSQFSFAQLKDCSACDSVKYEAKDFENNSPSELVYLRNEIYARHNYQFANERLTEYFRQFDWYHPELNKENKVELSEIELHNVQVIKKVEQSSKIDREKLKRELNELRVAVSLNSKKALELYFDDEIEDDLFFLGQDILTETMLKFRFDEMQWYKNKGLYKVTIDDGFSVTIYELRIEGAKVQITYNVATHSEQIEDPFEYPSTYKSEEVEVSYQWTFFFDGERLNFEHVWMAG